MVKIETRATPEKDTIIIDTEFKANDVKCVNVIVNGINILIQTNFETLGDSIAIYTKDVGITDYSDYERKELKKTIDKKIILFPYQR